MLTSFLSLVILALSAPAAVEAGLGKPVWSTTGMDPLQGYYNSIPIASSKRVNITPPDMCVQRAGAMCTKATMKAVRVTYNDCGKPWVLCRCNDANMSMDTLVNRFSTIPPGVRSYVGGALAVKASGPSAGSYGDFITFNGDSSHSLDKGTNASPAWQQAVTNSTCVPDDYANTSYAEDFAQVEVMYNYRLHKGRFPKNAACLNPQLNYMNGTARIRDANVRKKCDASKRPFYL